MVGVAADRVCWSVCEQISAFQVELRQVWNSRVPTSITRQLMIVRCQNREAGCCIQPQTHAARRSAAWHKYPQSVAPRHPSILPSVLLFLPAPVHIHAAEAQRLAAESSPTWVLGGLFASSINPPSLLPHLLPTSLSPSCPLIYKPELSAGRE